MSEADLQPLIDWLKLNPDWLFFSTFLIAFIESLALAGIIVPGVLMLFLVASVAGHLDFSLISLLMAGFLGAILGDGISFYLGRYFKHSIPDIWPFSRYPDALKMGETFFKKHGGKSVVLGRFIGPIRPVLPLIAGMFGMSQRRFVTFNISSAIVWAPFYLLPGYLTGKATQIHIPKNLLIFCICITAFMIIFALSFRYLSQRLQKGSTLYDALLLKQQNSRPLIALQKHYASFQTKHPNFEFPLASFTLLLTNVAIFLVWTFLTIHTETLTIANQFILNLAYDLRTGWGYVSQAVTSSAVIMTLFGDEAFLYISFICFCGMMFVRKHHYAFFHLVIAGILTAVITHALKQYFAIERPDITLHAPSSFSYPSGHSSGATVFYVLVASFIAQEIPHQKRWQIYLCFTPLILLIALSRVILGVHWLSDVIGGICLGLIISSFIRISYSFFYVKDQIKTRVNDRQLIWLGVVVWLIALLIYQFALFDITFAANIIKQI